MKRNVFIAFVFFCVVGVGLCKEKIALAVLDFEPKNISEANASAVTDLLRTALFNTGRFRVVERQQISRILQEHRFQSSGTTVSERAVEIGRLLNVQMMMVGTLTQLSGVYIINARIVDVTTGLVTLAEAAETRGGEDALPETIRDLAQRIASKIGLEGHIIKVQDKEVTIDLGKADALEVNQELVIIRPGEVVIDLEGRAIGSRDREIGILVISDVQDRFSTARVKKNDVVIQKGDRVQPILHESLSIPKNGPPEEEPPTPAIF